MNLGSLLLFLSKLGSFHSHNFFYGFEARCLFSVVFLHMIRSEAGYCVQTRFTNPRFRIKKQRTQTREILKGQKSLSFLPLLKSIVMGFRWENASKAFFLGNLAFAQKTR